VRKKEIERLDKNQVDIDIHTDTHIHASTINVNMKSAQSSVEKNPRVFFVIYEKRKDFILSDER